MRQEKKAELRKMTDADLEMVLQWRNDPSVRLRMLNQNKICLNEHLKWFKKTEKDSKRYLLIFEIEKKPLGCVNYHYYKPGTLEWGFYLAPNAQKGTGRILGEVATNYAFEELGAEQIVGRVLADNIASQKFHVRQGFIEHMHNENLDEKQMNANATRLYLLRRIDWMRAQGLKT